jgi:hypothetical protein
MAIQCVRPSNEVREPKTFEAPINFMEPQVAIASPCWSAADCTSNLLVTKPLSVCLDLEDLRCFEVVDEQFQHYGITLKNAIALQPSNPAYPPRSGNTVLMGAPKSGWLEATFSKPISKFCCYVTSSQRMVLSAYDSQDKLLVRQSLSVPNLAGFDDKLPPNAQMIIEEPNISRITFYAFDGQLTLDDLSFDF